MADPSPVHIAPGELAGRDRYRLLTSLVDAPNMLIVLEVVGVLLDPGLLPDEGYGVDPERLRPVGRLGGTGYMLPRAFRELERP